MWQLDHIEDWASKNWCFWIVVLEKTLESPLDSKEIKPLNPKGNQPWIFIGRANAEAEAPILWPPDAKSLHIGKAPDVGKIEGNRRRGWQGISCLESIIDSVENLDSHAGRDWGQEKGTTEDEMVGWHHRLNGRIWVDSGSWWWTGRPGVLQFVGLQS